jgi:hypothetical protein
MAITAQSGFYRLYYYQYKTGNRLGDLISTDLGGYYNAEKEGTPAKQVVDWIKNIKKGDFYLKPGTYFAIHEDYTNGQAKTSFVVKEEEVIY